MRRTLINGFCFAIVALGSTQLSAPASASEFIIGDATPAKSNYQTCMDYCMPEGWGFHHCNADCGGVPPSEA